MTEGHGPYTGLRNPLGAYRHFVNLLYLGAFFLVHGDRAKYVRRAARRVRDGGLELLSYAGPDAGAMPVEGEIVAELRKKVAYLRRCEALSYLEPKFRKRCIAARKDCEALIRIIEGGWRDQYFPMLTDKPCEGD